MTTYTTKITQMFTIPNPTGYVVNILYKTTGVDGEHTASIDGNYQFSPNEQESSYTPYNELTESVVLSWIPESQIENAYANIDGQIASIVNPPVSPSAKPLPWTTA